MKAVHVFILSCVFFLNPWTANANSLSIGSDGVEARFTHIWNRIETGFFGGAWSAGSFAGAKFGVRHEARLLDNHPWLQVDLGLESFVFGVGEKYVDQYIGVGIGPTGHLSLRYALSDRIYVKTTLGLTVAANIDLGNKNPRNGWVGDVQRSPVLLVPSWQIIGFEWDVL